MNKEEIEDYLKRIDELGNKLTGKDKETYAWLIYGYNQCAKLLNETEQQCKKQKEAINKAIEFSNKNWGTWCSNHLEYMTELQNILKEVSE